VKAGQVVAEIAPLPLSEADRDMLEAKLESAKALKLEADERVRRAETDAAQAERERMRVADLVAKRPRSAGAGGGATKSADSRHRVARGGGGRVSRRAPRWSRCAQGAVGAAPPVTVASCASKERARGPAGHGVVTATRRAGDRGRRFERRGA
jgi:hypothetical protein